MREGLFGEGPSIDRNHACGGVSGAPPRPCGASATRRCAIFGSRLLSAYLHLRGVIQTRAVGPRQRAHHLRDPAHIRLTPHLYDFANFAAANPQLFERSVPLAYYSESRLMSAAARAGWVEPDLKSLPAINE